MHIAVLGINYWPDRTGIAPFTQGRYPQDYAAELSRTRKDIAWLVAGDGAMRETLQERARSRGLGNDDPA
jgi:hypothetical protein